MNEAINLYLLEDHDGWFIVDTGLGGKKTQRHWNAIFETFLEGKKVKGIIVTHLHPDHIGQAGYLSELWRAPLFMSRDEYFFARALSASATLSSRWTMQEYYLRNGLPKEIHNDVLEIEQGYGGLIEPVPLSYNRLRHDDKLVINNTEWQVMVGRGHSPEHACLYNEQLKILISGDQILPIITPNISVYSTEPNNNSLQEYLDTLPQFLELPEQTLVLPAHNRPFTGLHARVHFMQQHHADKLQRVLTACSDAKTTFEIIPTLFNRKPSNHDMMFALGECLAHLNYLLNRGELKRHLNEDGAYLYSSC
jgi:glyoxylase-like metal-dependent hydrolase (beta-lactamase superfamily II)